MGKMLTIIVVSVLMLFGSFTESASKQIKKEATCPAGYTGLLPHPFICKKYLNCTEGRTYIQDCGQGTVFNPKLKVCGCPCNGCTSSTIDSTSSTIDRTTSTKDSTSSTIDSSPVIASSQSKGTGQYDQTGSFNHPSGTVQHHLKGRTNTDQKINIPPRNSRSVYYQESVQYHQTSYNTYTENFQANRGGSNYPSTNQHQPTSNLQGNLGGIKNEPGNRFIESQGTYSEDCNCCNCHESQLWNPNFPFHRRHVQINSIIFFHQPTNTLCEKESTNEYPTSNVNSGPTSVPEISYKSETMAPYSTRNVNGYTIQDSPNQQQLEEIQEKPKECQEDEFTCRTNECVPRTKVCDGRQHCSNAQDEVNCGSFLKYFTKILGARININEYEKRLNTSLESCAWYCLNSLPCRSFNFRRWDDTCSMCDTNVGISGALVDDFYSDYYELSEYSVNCSGLHECSNKKCINVSQVCDGKDDCGNRHDEKKCEASSIDYEIRFDGSDAPNEGQIVVKAFGEWGYICDKRFGYRTANIVCKELGFPYGALDVKHGLYFTKNITVNETNFLMSDINCEGHETSIRDCDFPGWRVIHNCTPQKILGVVCRTEPRKCPRNYWPCIATDQCIPLSFLCSGIFFCDDHSDPGSQFCDAPIELRLVNGTNKFEGRVEIRYKGVWGTICDNKFDDNDAKVVCRSLGYNGSAIAKKGGAFGEGDGPIWLDLVDCFGNESFINKCSHFGWNVYICSPIINAGVVCSNVDNSEEDLFDGKCGRTVEGISFGENVEHSVIQFRVAKGVKAKRGQYPWQATIRVQSESIKSSHWCGAVVISNKFVLTAAHCLLNYSKESYVVRAGDYNIDEDEGSEVEAFIQDFFIHERYGQYNSRNNDIALVKLKGVGFRFSKQIQPICLPEENTVYRSGLNCTISGFGLTEIESKAPSRTLRGGWVRIHSENFCKTEEVYGENITEGMFCAGTFSEGVDTCTGDSGGPLACLDKGLYTLYGITSWGLGCGHAIKPGVYVKVAHYRSWIDKKLKENA